jgi:hypothetical protein
MWKDTHSTNKLAQTVANRLSARTWQPSSLPLRPSSTPDALVASQTVTRKSRLKVTLGYSNLSKAEEFRSLAQSATLAFAKTPGQNAITWLLVQK